MLLNRLVHGNPQHSTYGFQWQVGVEMTEQAPTLPISARFAFLGSGLPNVEESSYFWLKHQSRNAKVPQLAN